MEISRDNLPARTAEAHAIGVLRGPDFAAADVSRIVCTTLGRAQSAIAAAGHWPGAEVACWFSDRFQLELASDAVGPLPSTLALACTPDLPPGPHDLAVLPLAASGEAEFTRELLQSALVELRIGGTLVASIDNPRDRWLREQLAATGERVRVRPGDDAVAYVVEKTREPAKLRDFRCEFAFRDRGRLLHAVSRPGVFSHRRIDPGARHLLNAVDVAPETRVLDIGCGSGCVAIGIAARDESVQVHAFDSGARAVECTGQGAALNGLANVTVALEAAGNVPEPGSWDLALTNPPYYSDFRIAELFVDAAWRGLAPGGTLLVVTKQPGWYVDHLPKQWHDVKQEFVKNYHLVEAVRP